MIKSLMRTIRGPSRDPRMTHVSRPLPGSLTDEEVLAALDFALAEIPNPAYLVETLPAALRQVTGRDYQVLDRTTRDVTGAFTKTLVMIRDGEVGLWPGYAARAYPMIAPSEKAERTRAAIAAAEGNGEAEASPTNPVGKPGWAPPPPIVAEPPPPRPVGTAEGGSIETQDAG